MSQPNGIVAMNPDKYREVDGVVFDLDSYARHCQPAEASQPAQLPQPAAVQPAAPPEADHSPAAPAPVFACNPSHEGWYPAAPHQPPVPIMGGALPPVQGCTQEYRQEGEDITVTRTRVVPAGSGSGSWFTSYITSYRTSYRSSGSGSWVFGSSVYLAGGYGLTLI